MPALSMSLGPGPGTDQRLTAATAAKAAKAKNCVEEPYRRTAEPLNRRFRPTREVRGAAPQFGAILLQALLAYQSPSLG